MAAGAVAVMSQLVRGCSCVLDSCHYFWDSTNDVENLFSSKVRKVLLVKNLEQYSESLVSELQAITTSGTIISYGLYTIENNPWLMLTIPYVLYGVFRYIYLVNQKNEGGAPDETLLKDKPILINFMLYVLTIVYLFAPIPTV